ncbi:MAG: glycosyl transferase [Rhodospirillaceae bacterium]|nr:glycosyl transferase [Rhodospirillaceae bacterium]|tara:strand:- start:13800 stop:14933 length:1134 start_codon:yes stop_codon:yes gene_type:complete
MPQIVHIIAGLNVGGAEIAMYRLISQHSTSRYTYTVISLTTGGSIADKLKKKHIDVIVFDFKKNPVKQFFKLFYYLRKSNPDVVSTWMYHANIIGGLAAYLAGVKKIIWGLRTTDVKTGSNYLTKVIRAIGSGLSYVIPNIIICPANSITDSHAKIGYSKNKFIVIHNGFDSEKIKFNENKRKIFREIYDIGPDKIIIGSLGRYSEAKDQNNFISAAANISRKQSNVVFLMVGNNLTKDNLELCGFANELNVSDKLILHGECADVSMCLSAMDIYCLHSRREGFPNALCEAMLVGLPCIATDVGDAKVLLDSLGVIVPKEDSDALTYGLDSLLLWDDAKKKRHGQQARRRICEKYSLAKACERYEKIYSDLLMDSKP